MTANIGSKQLQITERAALASLFARKGLTFNIVAGAGGTATNMETLFGAGNEQLIWRKLALQPVDGDIWVRNVDLTGDTVTAANGMLLKSGVIYEGWLWPLHKFLATLRSAGVDLNLRIWVAGP